MMPTALQQLLNNFSEAQLETIAGIALRIAAASSEKWTGQIVFSVNVHQGGLGDTGIQRNEVMRLSKKRGVRSGGV